jgi:hypothetical protein
MAYNQELFAKELMAYQKVIDANYLAIARSRVC